MSSINLLTQKWAETKNLKSFYFPEIDSTNDLAKNQFAELKTDFALYLTDHQNQGRGRGANTWTDQGQGETLLSTWCYRTDFTPQPILTPLLGLAIYESLFVFDSSLPVHLKAPNDIYLDTGKAAGLLVEAEQKGSENLVFVGLGLNVFDRPQVDVETSCLQQYAPNLKESWPEFCKYIFNQFQMALDKSRESKLSEDDCEDLLEALNAADPENEKYEKVSPQGDLHTSEGVIAWTDL